MPFYLTPKQERTLEYFEDAIRKTGRAPSLRQAAVDLGISHTAVSQFLQTLEAKGLLKRSGKYGRDIELIHPDRMPSSEDNWRKVPIIGRINAGLPLYAQQEWAGAVIVDGNIYQSSNLFALRVSGDSMKDAGILHGDIVICEPRQYAENGEIIVALIKNEEATVKRFCLKKSHVELRPENRKYEPVKYRFGEVMVQGKVVGVQRGPEPFKYRLITKKQHKNMLCIKTERSTLV